MLLKDNTEGAKMCRNNCSVAFASERTRRAIKDRKRQCNRAFNFQKTLSKLH